MQSDWIAPEPETSDYGATLAEIQSGEDILLEIVSEEAEFCACQLPLKRYFEHYFKVPGKSLQKHVSRDFIAKKMILGMEIILVLSKWRNDRQMFVIAPSSFTYLILL